MITYLIIILVILSASVLGIQIAQESTLAMRVKQLFGFTQPYPKYLLTLSKFSTWRQMIGTVYYVLLPILIVLILMFRLHYIIGEMLDCNKCVSFHVAWILLYFYLGLPIIASLVFAPLSILGIYLIESICK